MIRRFLAALLFLLSALLVCLPAGCAERPPTTKALEKPAPYEVPDLSGVWTVKALSANGEQRFWEVSREEKPDGSVCFWVMPEKGEIHWKDIPCLKPIPGCDYMWAYIYKDEIMHLQILRRGKALYHLENLNTGEQWEMRWAERNPPTGPLPTRQQLEKPK
jgi:hypothetical protein